jgi:hypothetical protein
LSEIVCKGTSVGIAHAVAAPYCSLIVHFSAVDYLLRLIVLRRISPRELISDRQAGENTRLYPRHNGVVHGVSAALLHHFVRPVVSHSFHVLVFFSFFRPPLALVSRPPRKIMAY